MEEYWVLPTWTTTASEPSTSTSTTMMAQSSAKSRPGRHGRRSDFDEHRKTLLTHEVDDGWRAELRRYFKTVFNVDKNVDVIKWWQVRSYSIVIIVQVLLTLRYISGSCR